MAHEHTEVTRALKSNVFRRVWSRASLTQLDARIRTLRLLAIAFLGSLLPFYALAGQCCSPRPGGLVFATFGGSLLLTCLTAWLVFGRGKRMSGRPRSVLLLTAFGTPILWLSWKLMWSSCFKDMTLPMPEPSAFTCAALTLLLSTIPCTFAFSILRATDPIHPRSLGAAIGGTMSAYATTLIELWCPIGHPVHLSVGHVLPAMLLAAVGAAIGEGCLAIRL